MHLSHVIVFLAPVSQFAVPLSKSSNVFFGGADIVHFKLNVITLKELFSEPLQGIMIYLLHFMPKTKRGIFCVEAPPQKQHLDCNTTGNGREKENKNVP